MKKRLAVVLTALSLLAAVLFTLGFREEPRETVYFPGQLLRLHVVAHSDSAPDQALKHQVRDAIIKDFAPEFQAAHDLEEARTVAQANLSRIEDLAVREIRSAGKNYPVAVELDCFAFPTKHYGPFVLPAGDYEAVRIVIGAGGGANWWCVLFPPLCFVDMTKSAATLPDNSFSGEGAGIVPGTGFAPDNNPAPAVARTEAVAIAPLEHSEQIEPQIEFRFRLLDLFKILAG